MNTPPPSGTDLPTDAAAGPGPSRLAVPPVPTPGPSAGAADDAPALAQIKHLYPEFVTALLAGDRRRCMALTESALDAGASIPLLYQHLFQRALYRVGREWEEHRISVGTEHLATAIIEGLLNTLYPVIAAVPPCGRRILVSAVEGELHRVGAKMVCDICELQGWEALYLGADTPTDDLLRAVHEHRPEVLGLSLSIGFHLDQLQQALARLRAAFPTLPLLIGGQGLREHGSRLAEDALIFYLPDLEALRRFLVALP